MPELVTARPKTRFSVFLGEAGRQALEGEPWAHDVDLVTHPLLGVRYLSALSEMTLLSRLARRHQVDVLDSVALVGPVRGHSLTSRPSAT